MDNLWLIYGLFTWSTLIHQDIDVSLQQRGGCDVFTRCPSSILQAIVWNIVYCGTVAFSFENGGSAGYSVHFPELRISGVYMCMDYN